MTSKYHRRHFCGPLLYSAHISPHGEGTAGLSPRPRPGYRAFCLEIRWRSAFRTPRPPPLALVGRRQVVVILTVSEMAVEKHQGKRVAVRTSSLDTCSFSYCEWRMTNVSKGYGHSSIVQTHLVSWRPLRSKTALADPRLIGSKPPFPHSHLLSWVTLVRLWFHTPTSAGFSGKSERGTQV